MWFRFKLCLDFDVKLFHFLWWNMFEIALNKRKKNHIWKMQTFTTSNMEVKSIYLKFECILYSCNILWFEFYNIMTRIEFCSEPQNTFQLKIIESSLHLFLTIAKSLSYVWRRKHRIYWTFAANNKRFCLCMNKIQFLTL